MDSSRQLAGRQAAVHRRHRSFWCCRRKTLESTTIAERRIEQLFDLCPGQLPGEVVAATAGMPRHHPAAPSSEQSVTEASQISSKVPVIGMTEDESWGKPAHVTTMIMGGHVHETWMYGLKRMLGFQDGRLALINVAE
jgi:hypothetical protein